MNINNLIYNLNLKFLSLRSVFKIREFLCCYLRSFCFMLIKYKSENLLVGLKESMVFGRPFRFNTLLPFQ